MDINSNQLKSPRDCTSVSSRVVEFDEFGFAVFAADSKPENERCHKYSRLNEDKQLVAQWKKIMSQSDWKAMHGCPSVKIQKLIRQGVPSAIRPAVWTKLLDADTLQVSSTFNYKAQLKGVREQLVDLGVSEYGGPEVVTYLCELESSGVNPTEGHINFECLRQILLDLDRSYPTHKMFIKGGAEGIEGRAALFRILATYARYNKEVGYCQGMSYLGGLLLMVMGDEQAAFWALVSLLERFKYLRGYYDKHMERIQRHVLVFQKLIKHRLPHIWLHLDHHSVSPLMFSTPWFLSLFTGLPCWETVLSIWDLFMLDGAVTIFRVGLGILDVMEGSILGSDDIASLLPPLLHPPAGSVSFLRLMPAVFDVYLEDWEVAQLEAVVMEETGLTTRPPSARRTRRSDTTDEPTSKRRRTFADPGPTADTTTKPGTASSSSLFQRFVNIFTPKEQRQSLRGPDPLTTAPSPHRTPSVPRARPIGSGIRSRYGQVYATATEEVSRNSPRRPRNKDDQTAPRTSTPKRKRRVTENDENAGAGRAVRRSPRLRQLAALRDLNTPSMRVLVGSGAEVQYSFKDFKASKPLRKSQKRGAQRDASTTAGSQDLVMSSPVEMKTLCKTQ